MRWLQRPNQLLARIREPRRAASYGLEVAGLGCLVGAAWWWVPIVGLVVLGLVLCFIGGVID
jgi:hypothetical protein